MTALGGVRPAAPRARAGHLLRFAVMLRLTAALALLLGLVLFGDYLTLVGQTPWTSVPRRHLRRMKDRATAPATITPCTAADFEHLPHFETLARYLPLEQRGVSIEGYVQRMLVASDGDVHLELAPTRRIAGGPDTTYITCEVTPRWRQGTRWTYGRLVAMLRPNDGGVTPWFEGPARARISGWLLYDRYDQVPSAWARAHGARLTGWEVHPVTAIETWDDSLGRFVELPR
jgi:hypothetical protein